MPRCRCSEVCACAVVGDGCVVVTGTGRPTDPYLIDASACMSLTVVDSDTVDLTMAGTGTTADPFTLAADVVLSADPGNMAVLSPGDGGVYVPAATAGGVTPVEGTDCISVTGNGTAATPWLVAPIIAPEPNGLDCSPLGMTVLPSTDVGNVLTVGTDSRLFVPTPPATGGEGTTVGDTQTIDLTLTDTQITGAVRVDPAVDNVLTATADGLFVPTPAGATTGFYLHAQPVASTTWVIPHNLAFFPNVTAVDSARRVIWPGTVEYTSPTTVTLTFSPAVAGEAFLS